MEGSTREYVIAGAVLFGALLLFGPLTFFVVLRALAVLLGAAGLSLGGLAEVAAIVAAALLALRVVTAVTRAELHGLDDLHRGPRHRRLTRHLVLLTPVVAVVVVTVDFLVGVGRWAVANGEPLALGLAALLALALAAGISRSVAAVRSGFGRAR